MPILFPAQQTCLSPAFGQVRPKIVEEATMVTNNSILLEWEVNNALPDDCLVFSIPPYIYILRYELTQGMNLFEEVRT